MIKKSFEFCGCIFKKVVAMCLVCFLMFGTFAPANEAKAVQKKEPLAMYQKMGIVTCTNVSIRTEPDTRASRYTRLENGTSVLILGEWDKDWYIIDLKYLGQGEGQGYALKEYIATNTYYITLNESTVLWADPFGSGIANGEKSKGATMLVLSETPQWFVVQTKETSAGSSFIKKSGLDYMITESDGTVGSPVQGNQTTGNTSNNTGNNQFVNVPSQNNQYVVTARTLAVRSEPDDNKAEIGYLHNGDIVNVIRYGEYFTSIEYVMAGQITECWVHTRYLKKIYK